MSDPFAEKIEAANTAFEQNRERQRYIDQARCEIWQAVLYVTTWLVCGAAGWAFLQVVKP